MPVTSNLQETQEHAYIYMLSCFVRVILSAENPVAQSSRAPVEKKQSPRLFDSKYFEAYTIRDNDCHDVAFDNHDIPCLYVPLLIIYNLQFMTAARAIARIRVWMRYPRAV